MATKPASVRVGQYPFVTMLALGLTTPVTGYLIKHDPNGPHLRRVTLARDPHGLDRFVALARPEDLDRAILTARKVLVNVAS